MKRIACLLLLLGCAISLGQYPKHKGDSEKHAEDHAGKGCLEPANGSIVKGVISESCPCCAEDSRESRDNNNDGKWSWVLPLGTLVLAVVSIVQAWISFVGMRTTQGVAVANTEALHLAHAGRLDVIGCAATWRPDRLEFAITFVNLGGTNSVVRTVRAIFISDEVSPEDVPVVYSGAREVKPGKEWVMRAVLGDPYSGEPRPTLVIGVAKFEDVFRRSKDVEFRFRAVVMPSNMGPGSYEEC